MHLNIKVQILTHTDNLFQMIFRTLIRVINKTLIMVKITEKIRMEYIKMTNSMKAMKEMKNMKEEVNKVIIMSDCNC